MQRNPGRGMVTPSMRRSPAGGRPRSCANRSRGRYSTLRPIPGRSTLGEFGHTVSQAGHSF
ncbi:hypothetical protein BN13_380021 [Nostocoides jenkinsii Ben 74]|uniref:Uncharacterized protein n=1 Tax=Nostocoides jenkinsii Ben 74 TaxID=1193518 RepID=A0A077MBY7_9MICO|nr:hypothetical protein BN13_380021 [Tetrasphaera jenkinsii Ben 74]